jgi:hypothetical protein
MGYTSELRNEGTFLAFTGSGVLTGPEIIETTRKLVEGRDVVSDVRLTLVLFDRVTKVNVSADDVRRLIEVDKRLMRRIPRTGIAIVVPKDELFGLSRMWEMMVGIPGWETRVFRSAAEAEAWLRTVAHPPQASD